MARRRRDDAHRVEAGVEQLDRLAEAQPVEEPTEMVCNGCGAVVGEAGGFAQAGVLVQVGGEVLFVESSRMNGKGKITITGRLGDVMKEAALAAMTWLRSNAERLGLDDAMFEKSDFHIHFPAGAIPKDGPSAGVAMCTSMVSTLSRILRSASRSCSSATCTTPRTRPPISSRCPTGTTT